MAQKKNNSQSKSNEPRHVDPQRTVLERVQELTWSMLDGEITDDEMSLLDTLLLTGDEARSRYVECVQLHTDLMAHYSAPKTTVATQGTTTLVLGFLGTGAPGCQSEDVIP
jgi:hypothetical protein